MIFFLGPPGSGKGTLSRLIASRHGFKVIAIGDLLRKEIESGSDLGADLKKLLDKGEFAPTSLILDLIVSNFSHNQDSNEKISIDQNVIIDGFPRSLEQAEQFDCLIKQHAPNNKNLSKMLVFDFVSSIEVLHKRLSGRRVCISCSASFSINSDVCDFCGSKKYFLREDDNKVTIMNRLSKFFNEYEKIVDFYSKKGMRIPVCADLDVEDVYFEIRSCMLDRNLI
jgi:adenylate kinase